MSDVRPRRRPAAFAVVSWALGLVLLVFVAAPLLALLTGTSLHEFVTTIGQADVRQALFVSVEAALLAPKRSAIVGTVRLPSPYQYYTFCPKSQVLPRPRHPTFWV